MTEATKVVLSKITMDRRVVQLLYVCDRCYTNPRLKRKHKTHVHGGGGYEKMVHINWKERQSFGTRTPHCHDTHNLSEVELIYDPAITDVSSRLIDLKEF